MKHIVGARLARALAGMLQGKPQPTPKLAGCRLAGQRLVLSFDAPLLGGEAVALQAPVPGTFVPLEIQIAPANVSAGSSGWVYAVALEAVNATSVAAVLPPGAGPPSAVRYAWGDYACCPGMNASTFFCPPTLLLVVALPPLAGAAAAAAASSLKFCVQPTVAAFPLASSARRGFCWRGGFIRGCDCRCTPKT